MTPTEMKAKGYTIQQDGQVVRLYQNGEYVASLSPSPVLPNKLNFDWHRHDQWGLRSIDVTALFAEDRQ